MIIIEGTEQQQEDGATTETVVTETTTPTEKPADAFARGVEEARAAEGGTTTPVAAEGATGAVETAGATGTTGATGATGATAAALTPEQKAAAEAKAAVDAEIKDLGLKEKKAERFRTLEAGYRESVALKREIEPLRQKAQQLDQFNEIMRDTGARPEQISTMFSLIKRSNSGDVGQMRSALKEVNQFANELAKACGEPVAAFSPINDHPDLLQKVSEGALTEEAAIELIRARATEARTREQAAARTQQQTQEAAAEQEKQGAIEGLNALAADLGTADPHYAHKLQQMIDSGSIALIRGYPPSQWVAKFKEAYSVLRGPPPKPKVAEMPIRPNGGSGGGAGMAKTVPTKAEDAFAFGVQQAREQGL